MKFTHRRQTCLLTTVLLALAVHSSASAGDFYLSGGERVIFFGDSITQSGRYVTYVEAFLRTRFPDKKFEVINHGISSETISGTSEKDHHPRRPHAHKRFTRDIAAWKPDVVVSCFGMNDGNYHPFDKQRFEKFQTGTRRLIKRVKQEADARLTILTPPPYDPYMRKVGDKNAAEYGYKFAAINYDQTLAAYSRWLLTIEAGGVLIVDLHGPMNEHLEERRKERVSFYLSGDAIHPGPTGHWLMAQQLLLAWNAPADVASCEIDARERKASDRVELTEASDAGVEFTWKSPLPLPMDPTWDEESIALERVSQRLNRYRLRVSGLAAGRYELFEGDTRLGTFTAKQVSAGIDLTQLSDLSTNRRAVEVLHLVHRRRSVVYGTWRKLIRAGAPGQKSLDQEMVTALDRQIAKLCRPAEVTLRVVKAEE